MNVYSVQQVADILKVTRQRVDQLIRAKRIKCERIGKVRIVHKDELNRFIKTR